MNEFAKNLINELSELDAKHKELRENIIKVQDKQVQIIKDLIETYKPVMEWYAERYRFTHPTIEVQTVRGPILGFKESERILIVYNVNKKVVEYIDMDYPDDVKNSHIIKVVKDGHFEEAVQGIKYLEIMLGKYVEKAEKYLHEIKNETQNC